MVGHEEAAQDELAKFPIEVVTRRNKQGGEREEGGKEEGEEKEKMKCGEGRAWQGDGIIICCVESSQDKSLCSGGAGLRALV